MKKRYLTVGIDNLIALCHVLDSFEDFNNKLVKLISTRDNNSILFKLEEVSKGQWVFNSRKAKKFYNENKEIIDTINNYSNIFDFIRSNYGCRGAKQEGHYLDFFYEYFNKNKDNLDLIIAVLQKFKQLQYRTLEFAENLDFTNEEYEINIEYSANFDVPYLDNMEIIPNSKCNIIKYRTTGSNYKLLVDPDAIAFYGGLAIVNSLVFDPQRLPATIEKKDTFDKMLSLSSEKYQETKDVTNSVKLSVNIGYMKKQFEIISKIVENIDNVKVKGELIEILTNMKNEIQQLEACSIEYDESVVENSSLTKEELDKEKVLYLRRRESVSIHWD